jgi:hypothetical protein
MISGGNCGFTGSRDRFAFGSRREIGGAPLSPATMETTNAPSSKTM